MCCRRPTPKTLLSVLGFMYLVAGVALLCVAAYVSTDEIFKDFSVDKYRRIPLAIVVVMALVMSIIGLISCWVNQRESKVDLVFFLLLILLIFAVEVTAFVSLFINRSRINGDLDKPMNEIFQKYSGENSETQRVDYLQTKLECCGVKNYTDWSSRPWFGSHKNSVPHSCCKANTTCTGQFNHPELLNTNGCKDKLEQLLQNVLTYAMFVILGFALIKFCSMLNIGVIIYRSSRNNFQIWNT